MRAREDRPFDPREVRRALPIALAGLIVALTAGIGALPASADEPCLGVDTNGDGAVDQAPLAGSNCYIVPFLVEPEKNNMVDLAFQTVHAAVPWTPSQQVDPAIINDVPLCFGDADVPSNRSCVPVTERGKMRDVNGDGHKDHIWKWATPDTNIHAEDKSACFYGSTSDGRNVEGCGPIGKIINGPNPALSVNDVAVTEGNDGQVTATFTVTLAPTSTDPVTVDYATADGTATVDDYVATSGQLTFAPGQGTQTVPVLVLGDTTPEPNETFTLQLSMPVGAIISDGSGTGTIMDDDTPVQPSITITDVVTTEGNSGTHIASLLVKLSSAAGTQVTVDYTTVNGKATAPSDYIATSGTLTFAPGETSHPIDVPIVGDTVVENDEGFSVRLTNAVGATISDSIGLCKIKNDD